MILDSLVLFLLILDQAWTHARPLPASPCLRLQTLDLDLFDAPCIHPHGHGLPGTSIVYYPRPYSIMIKFMSNFIAPCHALQVQRDSKFVEMKSSNSNCSML